MGCCIPAVADTTEPVEDALRTGMVQLRDRKPVAKPVVAAAVAENPAEQAKRFSAKLD